MSGYAKDTEKSCAAWLVFRNSAGDKIVVARKNDYTLFFNPNIPGDKGDIVDFLLHRLNGGAVDTTITQKGNTERLQQALARAVGYTPAPIDAAKEQAAKIPATYSIQPLNAASTLPFDVAQLLRIRGIQPNILLQPDLAAEVGLLHVSGSRHTNLFFRWRDEQGNPAGGQYKYLNVQTKGTAKYFLPGTPRHGSVWSTSLENRCSLFVCEDPFDAIAYRQLNPNKNFALLATGGAITAEQISIIKSKARQAHMAVVLGNDNDIAGQVSNLKIVDETAKIVSIDAKQQTATIRHGGEPEKKVSLEELKEIVVQRCRQARCELYYAAPNHKKDWNEELLLSSRVKATPSPALKAALSSYQTAPCQPQPLTNSAHYHP